MIETKWFKLYAHFGPYLINNDPTGLEEDEIDFIDEWCDDTRIANNFKTFICTNPDSEEWFFAIPDCEGRPGECLDFCFIVGN